MNQESEFNKGFVKLHRSMLQWEWFDEPNVFRVFMYCLLRANHKDKRYRGQVVKRGSFLTGRQVMAKDTKMTVQQVRTALNKLKSTNELTIKTTKQGTVIQVTKWDEYQLINQQNNQQVTNDQPTSNQQLTTNKNVKNDKEGEEITRAHTREDDLKNSSELENFVAAERRMKESDQWQETQIRLIKSMNYTISFQQLHAAIDEFMLIQRSRPGPDYRAPRDLMEHFTNWLRKNIKEIMERQNPAMTDPYKRKNHRILKPPTAEELKRKN